MTRWSWVLLLVTRKHWGQEPNKEGVEADDPFAGPVLAKEKKAAQRSMVVVF
jgi:hypothetical protein